MIYFKILILFLTSILWGVSCNTTGLSEGRDKDSKSIAAPIPPMGWNSFDAYDCRINEEEFRGIVDYMAENLLEYGWEYAVIDYVWWHPEPGNSGLRRYGHPNIRYVEEGLPLHPEYQNMDAYGRFVPAVERFPSSEGGKGFKPIGDYVHSKGLKFGIHIMYGVPRYAWYQDLPILGTEYSIRDIGEVHDVAGFCNHIYGIDADQPGAQEYYNSIFKLYAEWGVDFIKADGVLLPIYQKGEIEMMHRAIQNCGRDMVLSLSYGDAPLGWANHMAGHSNMWRISHDFWDHWSRLLENFDKFNAWSPFIGDNHWPDGDMLPIGRLALQDRPNGKERQTNFTWDEQTTLMTLWCIARSPLMLGADLLSMDDTTLSYITNPEVLYVNQHSWDNRRVYENRGHEVWIARDEASEDVFVALFNKRDSEGEVRFILEYERLRGEFLARDLWKREDMGIVRDTLRMEIAPHGAKFLRLTPR